MELTINPGLQPSWEWAKEKRNELVGTINDELDRPWAFNDCKCKITRKEPDIDWKVNDYLWESMKVLLFAEHDTANTELQHKAKEINETIELIREMAIDNGKYEDWVTARQEAFQTVWNWYYYSHKSSYHVEDNPAIAAHIVMSLYGTKHNLNDQAAGFVWSKVGDCCQKKPVLGQVALF